MEIRIRRWSALTLPVNGTTLPELLHGVPAVRADFGETVHISSSSIRIQGDGEFRDVGSSDICSLMMTIVRRSRGL